MRIAWQSNETANCLYGAAALQQQLTFKDQTLAEALSKTTTDLDKELTSFPFLNSQGWHWLIGLAASGLETELGLAELLLKKLGGDPAGATRLAGRITNLKLAYRNASLGSLTQNSLTPGFSTPGFSTPDSSTTQNSPSDNAAASTYATKFAAHLQTRSGPIKMQLAARGQGLLRQLGQLTDQALLVDSATIVPVIPFLGGGGTTHLQQNLVTFESLVVDPYPDLPESVRLAWLLSQLQLDLPRYHEQIRHHTLETLSAVAMIPPILAAAEYVELSRPSEETIRLALQVWQVTKKQPHAPKNETGPPVPQNSITLAETPLASLLWRWWKTYEDARPAWNIGLGALDQMLYDASVASS